MVFVWYFLRRFCIAFFAIAFTLAFLLNVVEFFEKVVRVSHTTLGTILYFVVLNFLPTFSDLMPIASWLAACLVIREFYHQQEWETLVLLSIDYGVLLKLFMLAGLVVASGALVFREYLTIPLSSKAELLRRSAFKQGTPTVTTKTWYKLTDARYCYVGYLDLNSKKGEDLLLITLEHDGNLQKSIRAERFDVHVETESLFIQRGSVYDAQGAVLHEVSDKIVHLPGLFLRLALQFDVPSLWNILKKLIAHSSRLSADAYATLTRALFERLFSYVQIILFPVITFILFSIFINFNSMKWVVVLLPYPLFTLITVLVFFLMQKYVSMWIFSIPLMMILLMLAGGFLMLQRSRRAS